MHGLDIETLPLEVQLQQLSKDLAMRNDSPVSV
jgi:hypothetical protein